MRYPEQHREDVRVEPVGHDPPTARQKRQPARDTRVLRSYLDGSAGEWIELDPCRGTWRSVARLRREPMLARGSFSDEKDDYLVSQDLGAAARYDSAGAYLGSYGLRPLVSEVEYYAGKYYVVYNNDSWLHVFPDSAAFWGGRAVPQVAGLQFPSVSAWDIAIVDGVVYWPKRETDRSGQPTDTVAIGRYVLAKYTALPPIRIGGFQGAPTGISSGADGRIWLLDGADRLYRIDVHAATPAAAGAWTLERIIRVRPREGSGNFYGLTRFREAAGQAP